MSIQASVSPRPSVELKGRGKSKTVSDNSNSNAKSENLNRGKLDTPKKASTEETLSISASYLTRRKRTEEAQPIAQDSNDMSPSVKRKSVVDGNLQKENVEGKNRKQQKKMESTSATPSTGQLKGKDNLEEQLRYKENEVDRSILAQEIYVKHKTSQSRSPGSLTRRFTTPNSRVSCKRESVASSSDRVRITTGSVTTNGKILVVKGKRPTSAIEGDPWSLLDLAIKNTPASHKKSGMMKSFTEQQLRIAHDSDNAIEGTEQDTQTDDIEVPPTPRTKSTMQGVGLNSQRTYGAVRSYLREVSSSIPDPFDLEVLKSSESLKRESIQEDVNRQGENGIESMKSIHELRALGGNSQFTEEAQYIIDGLADGESSKRASLIELAEKSNDKEFVSSFRSSEFADELYSQVTRTDDVFCTFLLGVITLKLLDDGSGIAVSMVSSNSIVPLLMDMITDLEDIRVRANDRKSGLSKGFKQVLEDFVQRLDLPLLSSMQTVDKPKISRGLVALLILIALGNCGEKVSLILQEGLFQHVPTTFKVLEILLGNVLESIEKKSNSDDSILVYLMLQQVELLIEANDGSILSQRSFNTFPSQKCLKLAHHLLHKADTLPFNQQLQTVITNVVLRIFILITTHFSKVGQNNNNVSNVDRITELYDSIFAKDLVEHATGPDAMAYNESVLFSWGLILNLSENEDICKLLLQNEMLKKLKSVLKS